MVIASTCNAATFDTKISVFSGDCDDLVCVAGNDDTLPECRDGTSEIGFSTTMGTVYFILVHGFNTQTGDFELTLTSFPVPNVSARIESSLYEGVSCLC
jgi:hypothetical protein